MAYNSYTAGVNALARKTIRKARGITPEARVLARKPVEQILK